jgi:uncharacterized protein GlcG (DUF336 family)
LNTAFAFAYSRGRDEPLFTTHKTRKASGAEVRTEAYKKSSIGKAVSAAGSGLPSGENLRENVYYPLTGIVVGSGVPDIRSRGGLPVIRRGKLEGAIGVSGAQTNEQDEECARAGIEALGEGVRKLVFTANLGTSCGRPVWTTGNARAYQPINV